MHCLFRLTCIQALCSKLEPHSECSNSKKLHRGIIHCPHSFCTIRKTQVMAVVRSTMFTSYFCFALWLLLSSSSASYFHFTGPFSNSFSVKYKTAIAIVELHMQCVWVCIIVRPSVYRFLWKEWKLCACCGTGWVCCAGRRLVLAPISKASLLHAAREPLQQV